MPTTRPALGAEAALRPDRQNTARTAATPGHRAARSRQAFLRPAPTIARTSGVPSTAAARRCPAVLRIDTLSLKPPVVLAWLCAAPSIVAALRRSRPAAYFVVATASHATFLRFPMCGLGFLLPGPLVSPRLCFSPPPACARVAPRQPPALSRSWAERLRRRARRCASDSFTIFWLAGPTAGPPRSCAQIDELLLRRSQRGCERQRTFAPALNWPATKNFLAELQASFRGGGFQLFQAQVAGSAFATNAALRLAPK